MNLSNTFGAIYWGFVAATALFGVSVVQGYFFFLGNRDAWKLRLFVALVLLLELSTVALSSGALHHYLVVNFGDPLALLLMTKAYVAEYVISVIVIFLSQSFYAWRIHEVSRKGWPPFVILCLAACSLGAGIALTSQLFRVDLLIERLSESRVMLCFSLATSLAAACDIVSTAAMCYYLASDQSAYKETNSVLRTVLFFAVNRGILPAITQIGFLSLFVAFPTRAYWMPFHLSLSKLHVNTILAMLNYRTTLRAKSSGTKLEISTNFVIPGEDSPNSPSPRTPYSKRYSGGPTFEHLDLPRDRRRPSVIFSNIHRQPPGIEEEPEFDDIEARENGKPMSILYTGGMEPITFA